MRVLCLLVTLTLTCAAQDVPAPTKVQDSGPTLEVTLKFISDKIGEEGKLAYTAAVTDPAQPGTLWTNKFEVELSHPVYSAAGCTISYHWRATQNGKMADDKDYTLNLREVQDLAVMTQEQNQKQVDARNGQSAWQSQIMPALFVLVARRPKKVDNVFPFSDEQMANRVAKAMLHAVELCGGGNNEPF